MNSAATPLSVLAAGMVLWWALVWLAERRYRHLLNKADHVSLPLPPSVSLDASPRQGLDFMKSILRREYQHHPNGSVRTWGALLRVMYAIYAVAVVAFVVAIVQSWP